MKNWWKWLLGGLGAVWAGNALFQSFQNLTSPYRGLPTGEDALVGNATIVRTSLSTNPWRLDSWYMYGPLGKGLLFYNVTELQQAAGIPLPAGTGRKASIPPQKITGTWSLSLPMKM